MKGKFRKFFIAACIISPFVFFGVAVVLADVWSGPANRTQTTPGACRVIHKHNGSWVCTEPCGEPEYNICTAACNAAGGCDSSETQQDPPTVVQLQDATCLRDNLLFFYRRQRLVQGSRRAPPERERTRQRLQYYRLRQHSLRASLQRRVLCLELPARGNNQLGLLGELVVRRSVQRGIRIDERGLGCSDPDPHNSFAQRLERLEQIRPCDCFRLGHRCHLGRGQCEDQW